MIPLLKYQDSLDFNQNSRFPLWKAAEKLLSFGGKTYQITLIDGKNIQLKKSSSHVRSTTLAVALKIMLCVTIALPLTVVAIMIKVFYRRQYSFEIINNLKKPNEILPSQEIAKKETTVIYKVEEVIKRIRDAKAEGYKVALFLCRGNNQSVPQEDGWKWFSLDLAIEGSDHLDRHLQMDFNSSAVNEIHHLFNKVVVDYSSVKFINHPWPRLHQMLEKREDSELVVESFSGYSTIDEFGTEPTFFPGNLFVKEPQIWIIDYIKQSNISFNQWKEREGESRVKELYTAYCQENRSNFSSISHWPEAAINNELEKAFRNYILKKEGLEVPRRTAYKELMEAIKKHVQPKFFNHVELRHGKFPYREDPESWQDQTRDFWVMRSPSLL